MQSVVTKSAEALGKSGKPTPPKYRVEKHDAFNPIAHETHETKAHTRRTNFQTGLTSPPVSTQLRTDSIGVSSVPTTNQLVPTGY